MGVRWGESSIHIVSFVKFRFSWKKRMLDKVINTLRGLGILWQGKSGCFSFLFLIITFGKKGDISKFEKWRRNFISTL